MIKKKLIKLEWVQICVFCKIIWILRKTKKKSKLMLLLPLEKGEDKQEKRKKTKKWSLDECYNEEWVLFLNKRKKLKNFYCLLCKEIANNAMELICDEHEDMKEGLVVGEQCLLKHLKDHNNQCPTKSHDGCNYVKGKTARNCIDDLMVICPRQFMSQLNVCQQDQTKEGIVNKETQYCCKFKGKIKDVKEHLEGNSCSLQPVECKFKGFGCNDVLFNYNFEQHMQEQMKEHLDLLFKAIQKKPEQHQWKENEQIVKEIEELRMKNTEQVNEIKMLRINIETLLQEKNELIREKDDQLLNIKQTTSNDIEKLKKDIELMKEEIQSQNKIILEKEKQIQEKKEIKQSNQNYDAFNTKQSLHFNFDFLCTSSKLQMTFEGHTSAVWSIDYSTFDSGQYICSGSADKTVRVWNVETTKQIRLLNEHSSDIYCVKFSPYHNHNHRRHVVCSSSLDKSIRFWDIKSDKSFQIFNGHTNCVYGIEFSSFNSGRYLCSGSSDCTIRLWDVETSKSLHIFNGHEGCVWCVDISPLQSNNNDNIKGNSIGVIGGNGYSICSGSYDTTIRTWDVETLKELSVLKGHKDYVLSVKYGSNESKISASSNIILSGSRDKIVCLWDIRSSEQIQFKGHSDVVYAVQYLPFVVNHGEVEGGSNVICSGSDDNTIRFWDVRSNKKELHIIKGEDYGILCLKFLDLKKKGVNNENIKNSDCNFKLCYGSMRGPIICKDNLRFRK
ncbi:G-protein beta WD-40 repeats containing protein [Reticulomyxa filosa]|uniref:G-protein beta WD-40 repeats containing protein n=1 Tax=Reticulomyxa filosa TaxID=46433 RepID=X6MXF2_RETFI|nr:G-protein beta WD-40 repeats containing protein [Reticulomyxa filosa]|eukprot:ETO18489.1 G-protein beta WD-40 repeats containing protein [Reticulomyxa filosa]